MQTASAAKIPAMGFARLKAGVSYSFKSDSGETVSLRLDDISKTKFLFIMESGRLVSCARSAVPTVTIDEREYVLHRETGKNQSKTPILSSNKLKNAGLEALAQMKKDGLKSGKIVLEGDYELTIGIPFHKFANKRGAE